MNRETAKNLTMRSLLRHKEQLHDSIRKLPAFCIYPVILTTDGGLAIQRVPMVNDDTVIDRIRQITEYGLFSFQFWARSPFTNKINAVIDGTSLNVIDNSQGQWKADQLAKTR